MCSIYYFSTILCLSGIFYWVYFCLWWIQGAGIMVSQMSSKWEAKALLAYLIEATQTTGNFGLAVDVHLMNDGNAELIQPT